MRVRAAAASHRGMVRSSNQDVAFVPYWVSAGSTARVQEFDTEVGPEPLYFGVSDGMGGHLAGEIAARITGCFFAECPAGSPESLLQTVNGLVFEASVANRSHAGMGATVAGIALEGSRVTAFNVGDARVYQASGGYLFMVSTDDRAARESVVLLQSIGGTTRPTLVEPHVREPVIDGQSRFMICSDGLYSSVPLDLMQELASAGRPGQATADLLRAALNASADDNVTICIVDIEPDEI